MESAAVTAGIFVIPTLILVAWFKFTNHRVEWAPLLWAGFSFATYMFLLRSGTALQQTALPSTLEFSWLGKSLSLLGTCTILALLPRGSFKDAGARWDQAPGSLGPAAIFAGMTVLGAATTSALISWSPNISAERLMFQATMPGLDEELFMRGLMLLLLHQAFGKNMIIGGAETGWALWLTTLIFGLLHGVAWADGGLQINAPAIVLTGFAGFVAGWARERTGSLVVPVVFHNAFNVALSVV